MGYSFPDLSALAALMLWPAIPLFWVPVHCAPAFFRRLGLFTYVLPAVTWLPLAYVLFTMRDSLLGSRIALTPLVNGFGALLLLIGIGLQVWTAVLLRLQIMGMPEVSNAAAGKMITAGPFAVVRHPTYLSHTLMLLGSFLWTEVTALFFATVIDALVVNAVIIPLEERELQKRFGKEYEAYRRQVPNRILPLPRFR